jgi:hypothetical protein
MTYIGIVKQELSCVMRCALAKTAIGSWLLAIGKDSYWLLAVGGWLRAKS